MVRNQEVQQKSVDREVGSDGALPHSGAMGTRDTAQVSSANEPVLVAFLGAVSCNSEQQVQVRSVELDVKEQWQTADREAQNYTSRPFHDNTVR